MTTTRTTPRRSGRRWPRHGPWPGTTRCTCCSSRTCFPAPASSRREFAEALNTADTALVLDIYPAREDPIPGVSSQLIGDRLSGGGRLVSGRGRSQAIVADAAPGDIVLTAGAGDVTAYGPLIVEALQAEAPGG